MTHESWRGHVSKLINIDIPLKRGFIVDIVYCRTAEEIFSRTQDLSPMYSEFPPFLTAMICSLLKSLVVAAPMDLPLYNFAVKQNKLSSSYWAPNSWFFRESVSSNCRMLEALVAWELWGVCSCISMTGEVYRADAVVCCAVRDVVMMHVLLLW